MPENPHRSSQNFDPSTDHPNRLAQKHPPRLNSGTHPPFRGTPDSIARLFGWFARLVGWFAKPFAPIAPRVGSNARLIGSIAKLFAPAARLGSPIAPLFRSIASRLVPIARLGDSMTRRGGFHQETRPINQPKSKSPERASNPEGVHARRRTSAKRHTLEASCSDRNCEPPARAAQRSASTPPPHRLHTASRSAAARRYGFAFSPFSFSINGAGPPAMYPS